MKISWKTTIIKFMFHTRFRIKLKNKKQQQQKKNAVEYTEFTHINVLFT